MLYGKGKYRYELVEGWAKLPAGDSFMDVGGVCTDPQGRVYVLSRSEYPITVFDRGGSRGVPMGKGIFRGELRELHRARRLDLVHRRPESHGLQVHAGWHPAQDPGDKDKPSDSGYHEAADLFERIATITHGGGPFNRPTGVAIAPSGEIYIADGYGNSRVHRFTADGRADLVLGRAGPGSLAVPVASPPVRGQDEPRLGGRPGESPGPDLPRGRKVHHPVDGPLPAHGPSASTRTTSST